VVLVVVLAAILSGAIAPRAAASAGVGRRVSVGLFGDSVTEGIVIPDFQREGLAAALTRQETHYGFRAGGLGVVAVNQYQWRFSSYRILGLAPTTKAGWVLVGAQEGAEVEPGTDGPSGYSAVTVSPMATVTTVVPNPDVEVMYTTSTLPCAFTVTSGTRSWTIDTYNPSDVGLMAAEYPITLGAGSHRLTVHGSSCGLAFDGVVSQKPVAPGTTQMQIDNDGHSGRMPGTDLAPRVEQAIVEQQYKVSVLLYGYIGSLVVSRGYTADAYVSALSTRARLARLNRGSCLIVAPTPMEGVGQAEVNLISELERSVARRVGCTYTTVLAHLWNPARGIGQGLLVLDGIHPTAKGYVLIARALAPIIAKLARS
jgi:hypothetical protein